MVVCEGDLVRGKVDFVCVANLEFDQDELTGGIDQDIGHTQGRPTFQSN